MNDEYKKLLDELKRVRDQLSLQDARIQSLEKQIEQQLKQEALPEIRSLEPEKISPERKQIEYVKHDWRSLESHIGKYILQFIGVALFLFGALFFVKYAIDRQWISPTVRVVATLAAGTTFIALSEYLRLSKKQWSAALLVGGIILYYIGMYAAYALYGLIGVSTACGACAIIASVTLFMSIRWDSPFVAYFSYLAGFASVFYLAEGHPNLGFKGLLFLLLFSLVAVGISLIKRWYPLAWVALVLIQCANGLLPNSTNQTIIGQCLILIIFAVIPVLFAVFKRTEGLFESALMVFASLFSFMQLDWSIMSYFHVFTSPPALHPFFQNIFQGLSTTAIAQYISFAFGSFFLLAFILLFAVSHVSPYLSLMIAAVSFSFYSNVVVLSFSGMEAFLFNFAAVLLLTVGLLKNNRYVSYLGAFLWGLVFVSAESTHFGEVHRVGYFKLPSMIDSYASLILFAFCLGAFFWVYRFKDRLEFRKIAELFSAGASLVPLYWVYALTLYGPYKALIFALYASLLLLTAFAYDLIFVACVGCASVIFACYYVAINYDALMKAHALVPLSIALGGLTLIFTALYLLLMLVRKNAQNRFYGWIIEGIGSLALLSLFILVRAYIIFGVHYYAVVTKTKTMVGSLIEYFTKGKGALAEDTHLQLSRGYREYALAVYYGISGLLLVLSGFAYKKTYLRYAGLFLFFVTVIQLCLVIATLSNTLTRIAAFIGVGCILLGASYFYQRMAKKE